MQIELDDELLEDCKHAIKTIVKPGSGQILQFVVFSENTKKGGAKDRASEKAKRAKQQAEQQWEDMVEQVKSSRQAAHARTGLFRHKSRCIRNIFRRGQYFADLSEPLSSAESR